MRSNLIVLSKALFRALEGFDSSPHGLPSSLSDRVEPLELTLKVETLDVLEALSGSMGRIADRATGRAALTSGLGRYMPRVGAL